MLKNKLYHILIGTLLLTALTMQSQDSCFWASYSGKPYDASITLLNDSLIYSNQAYYRQIHPELKWEHFETDTLIYKKVPIRQNGVLDSFSAELKFKFGVPRPWYYMYKIALRPNYHYLLWNDYKKICEECPDTGTATIEYYVHGKHDSLYVRACNYDDDSVFIDTTLLLKNDSVWIKNFAITGYKKFTCLAYYYVNEEEERKKKFFDTSSRIIVFPGDRIRLDYYIETKKYVYTLIE